MRRSAAAELMVMDPGYSIFESVLTPRECDSLVEALSALPGQCGKAGIRNLMSSTAVSELAWDERLISIAAGLLGGSAVPYRATLFQKSTAANWNVLWHQDRALPLSTRVSSAEWGPWSKKQGVLYALAPTWALERVIALRVHLDPSTIDNGPLHVIPGSHKLGVVSNATRATERIVCLVGRGGVLAMRPLLLHSSQKARDASPRRVIHIEYADHLELAGDIRLFVA